MENEASLDEDLVRRLPLPLAQLYRRAFNAKTPLERHLTAFHLWEAGLKLLASVAIVEYARHPDPDPLLAERLHNLARPALGHWWEFVRRLVPVLAEQGDVPFQQVRDLVLGRTRDDFPRAAGLDAVLRQVLEGQGGARATVRFTELFDRLVQFRNKILGHAAPGQLKDDFNERVARALLAGMSEILGRVDVLVGRRLLYVAEVRQVAGQWQIQCYELIGESARRLAPLERPRQEAGRLPDGERVYLDGPGADKNGLELAALHPLVLYDAEAEEVLFLNARRGRERTEYLCYTTGRTVNRPDLGGEQRQLLARVLGMPVEEAQVKGWQDKSQAEESPLPATAPSSRAIGEFELLSELGRGGMGVVYRAWQPSLGRQVALKCLLRTGDAKAETRFFREIRALGRVEHQHLVKIFTSGGEGDQWFYVMELVEGATLAAVCDKLQSRGSSASRLDLKTWQESLSTACEEARQAEKPLSEPRMSPGLQGSGMKAKSLPEMGAKGTESPHSFEGRDYLRHVVDLVRQVAEALHALHEAKAIHRDVKPGNIMVGQEGTQAVLMDLGLAQLADDVEGRLTRTRQFVGTLRYASPEQVLAVGGLDRRTDIYSLGATLWELLTLRPLFGANEQTPSPELMQRIQYDEPERPRKFHPAIPADLEAIVLKCLEKKAERRYATARDLAADLGRFLAGDPVQARPISSLERGARWLKRRPALVYSGLFFLLAVLALAGGIWQWQQAKVARHAKEERDQQASREQEDRARAELEAHQIRVEYFAGKGSHRWGVYEGIGPISPEMARYRYSTWKFYRRGGRVEKVEIVNGHDVLTTRESPSAYIDYAHDTNENRTECRYEYQYDAQGQVSQEAAYDVAGQNVWTFHFTTRNTGYSMDSRGFPRAQTGSGAAYVEFNWSSEGLPLDVHYLDGHGRPQPDRDHIYGRRFKYDAHGLTVEETYLDRQDKPMLHPHGFARETFSYDTQDNYLEKAYWDIAGRPALTRDGYTRIAWIYDEHGNKIEQVTYGLDNRPALQKEGYARVTVAYDQGDRVEQAYFGVDGQPALYEGYWRVAVVYDARGNRLQARYFGVDGKPTLSYQGYTRIAWAYDGKDHLLEEAYFSLDDKPMLGKEGFARLTQVFDAHGRLIEKDFFGLDGRPALTKTGRAKTTWTYDDQDHESSEAYFGLDGKPTLSPDGFAKMTFAYDDRGNQVEEALFDREGKPGLHKEGYSRTTREYDPQGNLSQEEYFGRDGRPTLIVDGFARLIQVHDERGNLIEEAFFGLDGKPALKREGFARITYGYDDRGNNTEVALFDREGKPALHREGHSRITRDYDAQAHLIQEDYFGRDGLPTLSKNGYARVVYRYNNRGNQIEVALFDREGKPALHKEGHSRITRTFDSQSNLEQEEYFGRNGLPTLSVRNYAKLTEAHDERGNLIEQAYFGLDGKPTLAREGYARIVYGYDTQGNLKQKAYFDTKGSPALVNKEYAKLVQYHDSRGNVINATYFGLDGKPTRNRDGIASYTATFDDRGHQIEIAYFDPEGKPTLNLEGVARSTAAFDTQGNPTEAAYFGLDGKPTCILSGGYSRFIWSYDTTGNSIEQVYLGIDGKPTLHKQYGFARFTARYDERGNRIEQDFFGVDGQPILMRDGYAKDTMAFDAQGNEIEETYYGLNDKPIEVKFGFARVTRTYNDRGIIIGRAYWGADNQPVRHKTKGYARSVLVYDDQLTWLDATYYDVDGKPLQPRPYIKTVNPGSPASLLGLKPDDFLMAYGGKEIQNTPKFLAERRAENQSDEAKELRVLRQGKLLTFHVPPGLLGFELEDRIPPSP